MTNTEYQAALIGVVSSFVSQRPGMSFADYGDATAYRADARRCAQQLNDARALLAPIARQWVELSPEQWGQAFSDRLTIEHDAAGLPVGLDYTTGQYWCVEYRAAVCRALLTALSQGAGRDFMRRNVSKSVLRRWM